MTGGFWRPAACIALCLLWFSTPAGAASVRFVAESETAFERRLAAEIASVGFNVELPATEGALVPADTAAIVYVRSAPPQVELWLLSEDGKFQLSSVVRDDAAGQAGVDADAEMSALRIAEQLRALLQPVYVQAKVAEAAAQRQASAAASAAGPGSAAPVSDAAPAEPGGALPNAPSVAGEAPVRPERRPRRLPDARFRAGAGLGLGQHTDDVIPQVSLQLDFALSSSFGIGALGVFPLRKASIDNGTDHADLEVWMGGVHGYARLSPLAELEFQPGAGLMVAYLHSDGEAESPRFGRSVSGSRWVPFIEGALAYGVSRGVSLRGAALLGVGLPDTAIQFAGESVATWGRPWVLTQVALGYAW